MKTSILLLLAVCAAIVISVPRRAGAAEPAESSPRVLQAGLVAPNILGLTIQDGALIRGGQAPYAAQPGDVVKIPQSSYTPANTPQLWRGGAFVGWLIEDRKTVCLADRVVGSLSSTNWLEQPGAYTIQSADDPRFSKGGRPAQVYRKSMPHATARYAAGVTQARPATIRHTVYLKLDAPWKSGATYRISFPAGLPPLTVTLSERLESEAIHATQAGFSPQDEPKVAFLSCWLGTGGALAQPDAIPFKVVDAGGREVFQGKGVVTTRAGDNESAPWQPRNLTLTDVVMLDFTPVRTPGEYRVVVPGVGSSYPVTIALGVWRKTFLHGMKAFYHQRSGLELRPPYTTFRRPRNMHPADGVKIYQSSCTLLDSGNGLNARGTDHDNFGNLVKGATGQRLGPEAWGGYADAGDWDRRIQHLEVTRRHLDLLLEGGAAMEPVKLSIPENGNALPDLLDEALWNLDFYRRLMTPEGGVRGGIESAEHPKDGEASWQETWPHYAYAPDAWCSYLFAASAARCAHYADGKHPEVAAPYRAAALKAMAWAEAELARLPADYLAGKTRQGKVATVLGRVRNLAAADLYRLTGEPHWHELFLKTLSEHDEESGWVYLRTGRERDRARVEQLKNELLTAAQRIMDEQRQTGFRWTRQVPGAENWSWGLFARPDGGETLARAWRLTGDARYRQAMVLAAQMGLGANPNNMTYTSGLGRNPMRNIFYQDAFVRGLGAPDGITAFGPLNPQNRALVSSQINHVEAFFVPQFQAWPQAEFCLDTGVVHSIDEYTPDGTLGPVAYLWGTLACGEGAN